MDPDTKRRLTAKRVADTCNRIEGVPISKFAQELSRQWVHGEISGNEMIRRLVEQYRREE